MKAKPLQVIILALVGLSLLVVATRFRPSGEPLYQDKPVSVWFKEYAFASNSPAPRAGYMLNSGGLIVRPASGMQTLPAPTFTNRAQQLLWLQQQMVMPYPPPPDPAWEALRALGPKAVPHLVQYLPIGVMDRAYARAFTNLPPALRRKLPNPWQKQWLRIRAIDTLAKLGDEARAASPLLLELLKQPDPSLRRAVLEAIRRLHVDRRSITVVLLQLGSQRKYADVLDIAENTGWEGEEMVHLLGAILQSPDPALRRRAMTLLERAGPDAMPELGQITAALKDPDREVRYLASRSLEAIGTNTPQVIAALRSSRQDDNVMVRNVATRALTNLAPGPAQSDGLEQLTK